MPKYKNKLCPYCGTKEIFNDNYCKFCIDHYLKEIYHYADNKLTEQTMLERLK